MPNYYNPYNFYPVTYPYITTPPAIMNSQNGAYGGNFSQASSQPSQLKAMEWVEGEVGAKAFQMPQGWPANQPIPLWDSTDTVIYLKSWSPMGIPNPMQKIHYDMPETQNAMNLQSGAASPEYVTKDDLKALRDEIQGLKDSMNARRNQNGSNNQQNRGGGNNG